MTDSTDQEIIELAELNRQGSEKNLEFSSLLDEFLMNQSKDIQRQVRKTVEIWGINKDDPFFLILLQCRINQILYELTPNQIQQSFEIGNAEITKNLEFYKTELLKLQTEYLERHRKAELNYSIANLNSAIAKVLEDNNLSFKKSRFSPRVAGSLIAVSTALLNLFIGFWAGSSFNQSPLALDWKKELEAQERVLLDWAKSAEGQLAKNIVEWNEDLAGNSCEERVRDLGISFQVGSKKITSGFCVLFIKQP